MLASRCITYRKQVIISVHSLILLNYVDLHPLTSTSEHTYIVHVT